MLSLVVHTTTVCVQFGIVHEHNLRLQHCKCRFAFRTYFEVLLPEAPSNRKSEPVGLRGTLKFRHLSIGAAV